MANLNDPGDLERGQRLPHRGARDSQSLGKFALRQQPVARLQTLDVDVGPQPICDLFIESAATDGLQRTRHLRQSCTTGTKNYRSNHWATLAKVSQLEPDTPA